MRKTIIGVILFIILASPGFALFGFGTPLNVYPTTIIKSGTAQSISSSSTSGTNATITAGNGQFLTYQNGNLSGGDIWQNGTNIGIGTNVSSTISAKLTVVGGTNLTGSLDLSSSFYPAVGINFKSTGTLLGTYSAPLIGFYNALAQRGNRTLNIEGMKGHNSNGGNVVISGGVGDTAYKSGDVILGTLPPFLGQLTGNVLLGIYRDDNLYKDYINVGNVGVKLINPQTDLDVNGSTHISGNLTVDGNLTVQQYITLGGVAKNAWPSGGNSSTDIYNAINQSGLTFQFSTTQNLLNKTDVTLNNVNFTGDFFSHDSTVYFNTTSQWANFQNISAVNICYRNGTGLESYQTSSATASNFSNYWNSSYTWLNSSSTFQLNISMQNCTTAQVFSGFRNGGFTCIALTSLGASNQNLSTNSNVTLNNLSLSSNLYVGGNTYKNGNLLVTGSSTFANITSNGNISMVNGSQFFENGTLMRGLIAWTNCTSTASYSATAYNCSIIVPAGKVFADIFAKFTVTSWGQSQEINMTANGKICDSAPFGGSSVFGGYSLACPMEVAPGNLNISVVPSAASSPGAFKGPDVKIMLYR